MTTELYRDENVALTRFYGGTERGVCVQITDLAGQLSHHFKGYANLTVEAVEVLLPHLAQFVKEYKEEEMKRTSQQHLSTINNLVDTLKRGVENRSSPEFLDLCLTQIEVETAQLSKTLEESKCLSSG